VLGAGAVVAVILALLVVVPATRRGALVEPPPAQREPPAQEQPPAPPEQGAPAAPAEGQPAPAPEASPAPGESQVESALPLRQMAFAALPLLLGLFWLLSAWLVDSEARRAFVVQEPWGERRTVAYTALAVGCVFPLILAGLIFSAWGFVTFVLDVSRRQSPVAGLQAGALVLMICTGFLIVRGAIARWLDSRRPPRV
jgi:hypothetical protein